MKGRILALMILVGCTAPEREGVALETGIVGELYFLASQDRYYDQEIVKVDEFKKSIDKINDEDFSGRYREQVLTVKDIYSLGLENQPCIYLVTKSDSLYAVILSEVDYKEIKKIDKQDLQKGGKKVVVSVVGRRLTPRLYKSEKAVTLEVKDGLTLEPHQSIQFPDASR